MFGLNCADGSWEEVEKITQQRDCNNETDRQILIRKLIQLTLSKMYEVLKRKVF